MLQNENAMMETWKARTIRFLPFLLLLASFFVTPCVHAQSESLQNPTIEVFVREGCHYCAEAEKFLTQLRSEAPNLIVIERDISKDPQALEDFQKIAQSYPSEQIGVPTFRIGKEIIVGFDAPETTGRKLKSLLGLDRTTETRHSIRVPLFGEIHPLEFNLPALTIILGLIDGFNPCAMWVLLFLLSLLVHVRSRRKMALIAGTFVLVSGVVYYAFMAAWLNFFTLVGVSRWIQLALGIIAMGIGAIHIKDYFHFKKGPSLSISESAKSSIGRHVRKVLQAEKLPEAILGVCILALMVNAVELLCTAGIPAIYTQILSTHDLPAWKHYSYLLLYNAAYLLDDAAMVILAVLTLNPRRLQEKEGRGLKLVSGIVIVILGVLLIFKPAWLSWSAS